MKISKVDAIHPAAEAIAEAAALLRRGGLVVFPTETVYGLGAHALDAAAVSKVFRAKGRPGNNPLIVHCSEAAVARRLSRDWPEEAAMLAAAFWPGPLTMVLPRGENVPAVVTAGLPTVGLRVPRHPVALALLAAAEIPIAAPSANRFMEISPTAAGHVLKSLGESVDLLLDAGPTPLGIESTVIDLSRPDPVLLRPGSIGPAELERVLGRRLREPEEHREGSALPAPGMLRRHYSPRAKLILVDGGSLAGAAREAAAAGSRVGALLRTASAPAEVDRPIRMPPAPEGYGRALYASLHQLDDEGCDLILVEDLPRQAEWAAIRDRLARAAA